MRPATANWRKRARLSRWPPRGGGQCRPSPHIPEPLRARTRPVATSRVVASLGTPPAHSSRGGTACPSVSPPSRRSTSVRSNDSASAFQSFNSSIAAHLCPDEAASAQSPRPRRCARRARRLRARRARALVAAQRGFRPPAPLRRARGRAGGGRLGEHFWGVAPCRALPGHPLRCAARGRPALGAARAARALERAPVRHGLGARLRPDAPRRALARRAG